MRLKNCKASLNKPQDGILVLNSDGIITYVNKAISGFTGCEPSELIGKDYNTLIANHVFSKRSTPLRALQEKRKISASSAFRGQKILATATPYINGRNEVECVISNVRNLGELDILASAFLESPPISDFLNRDFQDYELCKKTIKEKLRLIGFSNFCFESSAMTEILETALTIAPLQVPVLIMGESGVGKGHLSQVIHKASSWCNNAMIEINCGSFSEGIIDSELFGYTEGTFTGANKGGKVGLIEAANNSTLLLDEIAAMPLEQQIRLLKFLDDGYILPLGSTKRKKLDVRVIALTNYDLQEQVGKGKFRRDLYYRISVVPIVIPPLRGRKNDIDLLIETFLEYYRRKYVKDISIDHEARRYLIRYDYPGNVRELKNIIERLALITKGGIIDKEALPPEVTRLALGNEKMASLSTSGNSLKRVIRNYEDQIIERLMSAYSSTYKVAKVLGVSQSTVVRKMKNRKKVSIVANSER